MLFYEHKPLTETKEYNFLGTVIDHNGCFKRGIQELSKKKLDEINERLQRPTTSCSNRIRMRPLQRFDIFEINDSCRKAGTRPNSLLPRRESSEHRPRPLSAF